MNNQDIQQSLTLLRELYKKDQEWLAEQKKSEIYNANRFNPFRFLRKDELGLSAILAFFLNPKEEHGQGDIFLNSFLKKLNLYHFLAYDDVEIITEKLTWAGRKHDIFIKGKLNGKTNWVFSIENKLNWAGEQPEQIQHYLEDLESNYGVEKRNYFLMFLPVESYQPNSVISPTFWEEKVNTRNAIVWDARLVTSWLTDISIISPKIQDFVNFFIKHLKENIMGESKNSSKLATEIVEDPELIKMSIELINSKNDILRLLILRVQNDLKEKFYQLASKNEWVVKFDQNKIEGQEFSLIHFHRRNNWNDFSICIQFNFRNFNDLFFGLNCNYLFEQQEYSSKDYSNYEKSIFQQLDKIHPLKSNLDSSRDKGHWTYWKYFNGHLRTWDSETWSKIPSGQLADEIWQEIEPLCRAVTQLNYPQN